MIRSAFLSPKEAESSSINKPSLKAAFGYNIEEGTRESSSRRIETPIAIGIILILFPFSY
jgi:hypothetical protein